MLDEMTATTTPDFEANRKKVAMALSMQRGQQRSPVGRFAYDALAAYNMGRRMPQASGLLAPPHTSMPPPMPEGPMYSEGY